jgi:hypothetical protein
VARVYNYFLGGTTNWEVDRSFGDYVLGQFPLVRRITFAHRLFLHRVVRYLIREHGVCQFLDVGSGVPSAGAAHEVADDWAICERRPPRTRVVYVDNDPVAVAHANLLLDRQGDRHRHAVVNADLRNPDELWRRVLDTELIDRSRPIALLLVGMLHLEQVDMAGNEIGAASVARMRELLPAGSYVAISQVTDEKVPSEIRETLSGLKEVYDDSGSGNVIWRSRAEVQAMLGDCQMLEPGWTAATAWRPEENGPGAPVISFPPLTDTVVWAGVGRRA